MATNENKTVQPHHIEAIFEGKEGLEDGQTAPVKQKTTLRMGCFSIYIGLCAWIYNFDLGKCEQTH